MNLIKVLQAVEFNKIMKFYKVYKFLNPKQKSHQKKIIIKFIFIKTNHKNFLEENKGMKICLFQ